MGKSKLATVSLAEQEFSRFWEVRLPRSVSAEPTMISMAFGNKVQVRRWWFVLTLVDARLFLFMTTRM